MSTADFGSSLVVNKSDNILVQWGKMITSNVCANWWVAPLLVIVLIYVAWRLYQAETKLANHEGMRGPTSGALPSLSYVQGTTKFSRYRGTNETLSHRDNAFGEAPSFWNAADGSKPQEAYDAVTAPARAVQASGLSDLAGAKPDASEDAIVAEAFSVSQKDGELAAQLAGN